MRSFLTRAFLTRVFSTGAFYTRAQSGAPVLDQSLHRHPLPALLLSVLMHALLLVAVGLVWSSTSGGTGSERDRPVGIALVHRLPDRDRYVDARQAQAETEVQQPSEQAESETQSSSPAAETAPPADLSPPIDLAGVLSAMKAVPSPASAQDIAGDASLPGDAFGNGSPRSNAQAADELTTQLFGVSGSGSRIVYVFDRSDSMNGYEGRPLRAAKQELIRSLRSLSDKQQFQIVFYNDEPKPFQLSGSVQLVRGEGPMIARATDYVDSIRAFGGTEHETALKLALRMSPDVIFFLTDARVPRLSESQLREIWRRAQRSGTTIHAIEFGPEPIPPVDSFLRDLAAQNSGQYQYIDVQQLGQTP